MRSLSELKSELWDHQREAVSHWANVRVLGVFFDPGTGKTATAITCYLEKCEQERRYIRCAVVVPNCVVRNWATELEEWGKLGEKVCVIDGKTWQKRVEQLRDTVHKPVVVFSHDAVGKSEKFRAEVLKYPFEYLILDESHRCKGPSTNVTKAVTKVADRCKYKQILTGTPILNGYEDTFAQVRILGAEYFGDSYFLWRKRWFEDKNQGKPWAKWPDFQPTAEGRRFIENVLARLSISKKKSECLDLPPLVRQVIEIEPTAEVAKHYKEMSKSFVTLIKGVDGKDDDFVEAPLVISKMLRLQQICSGVLQGDEKTHTIPCNKDAELKQLLEEITPHHKVIVWCNYKAPILRIKKIFEELYGTYWCCIEGGQSPEERERNISDFQNRIECRAMVANQAAGGIGINLQAASYMIYYSKDFDLEKDIQSEARAYRGGSEIHESVTRIDFVTKGTIEEDITRALREKLKLSELVHELKRRM